MRILLLVLLLSAANPVAAQTVAHRASDRSSVIQRAVVYHPAIRAAAARYGVDPHLIWTIAYLETRFRPRLISPKGARGLMQFIPATGRRYGLLTLSDLHDPLRSIDAAARYVRDLSMMFDRRIDLVLAGYNAGENAVIESGYRVPRYRETQSYVARGRSIFERIVRANIFSIALRPRVRTPEDKPDASATSRFRFHHQPAPTRTHSARSIYFSL